MQGLRHSSMLLLSQQDKDHHTPTMDMHPVSTCRNTLRLQQLQQRSQAPEYAVTDSPLAKPKVTSCQEKVLSVEIPASESFTSTEVLVFVHLLVLKMCIWTSALPANVGSEHT